MPRRTRVPTAALCALALLAAAGLPAASDSGLTWRLAEGLRAWEFPRDHGSHPDFEVEWWYFTGNLAGPGGRKFGYQMTIFRKGVRSEPQDPANPWSVRDVFLGHFALADIEGGRFLAEDLLSRSGPGLAGAATDDLNVWILGWSARMTAGTVHLEARKGGRKLKLELRPRKPVVLQGGGGLSRKGPGPGEASYYVSIPNLETKGEIVLDPGGPSLDVSGTSWFDHEFGSHFWGADKVGWDWFGLHLEDGRDLMLCRLRRRDGSTEPASSGALVDASGKAIPLGVREFSVETLARWSSPRSGGVYPARWRVVVPGQGIDLVVVPLLADQELVSAGIPDLVYWEGAVEARGRAGGRDVRARGYVELTGYAGSLRAVFGPAKKAG